MDKFHFKKLNNTDMKNNIWNTKLSQYLLVLDREVFDELLSETNKIISQALDNKTLRSTLAISPKHYMVGNQPERPDFICVDYALASINNKACFKLIEMQGFSSICGFLSEYSQLISESLGDKFHCFCSYENEVESRAALLSLILDGCNPENVVLLESNPEQQSTLFDFKSIERIFGIKYISLNDLIIEKKSLFYHNGSRLCRIDRIYNRIITSSLSGADLVFYKSLQGMSVTWANHPDWFYLISKSTLPYLDSPFVPKSQLFNFQNIDSYNLNKSIIKPLWDYAGRGFIKNPQFIDKSIIGTLKEHVIQEKVKYFQNKTTNGDAAFYTEVRLLMMRDTLSGAYNAHSALTRSNTDEQINASSMQQLKHPANIIGISSLLIKN
jgi:hypothetical protein